jgi:hypothetical protein
MTSRLSMTCSTEVGSPGEFSQRWLHGAGQTRTQYECIPQKLAADDEGVFAGKHTGRLCAGP